MQFFQNCPQNPPDHMKQILTIAQRELRTLFCSPVAWLTLIVFTIHAGFSLMGRIDINLEALLTRDINGQWFTQRFFSGNRGVFLSVINYFYLYVPFLTMGLMSREFSDGSIKLLFSSPVKLSHIVIGKFITVPVFALLLVFILFIQAVVVHFFVLDSFDWPLIFGGLLIVFLVICLYGAIGLFVSSLTSYQLVAAVGTFAIIFIMNSYLRTSVQNDHPEFLQIILNKWLPPNMHFSGVFGLLTSTHILYYLLLITLFIIFTWFRLFVEKKSKSFIFKFSVYTFAILLTVFLGWLSIQPNNIFYFDLTADKVQSPSAELKEVMKKLPEAPTLVRYVNVLERPDEGSIISYPGRLGKMSSLRYSLKQKIKVEFIPYYGPTASLYHTLYKKDSFFTDASQLVLQTYERRNVSSEKFNLKELAAISDQQFSWFTNDELLTTQDVKSYLAIDRPENKNVYLVKSGNKSAILQNGTYEGANEQKFVNTLNGMLEGKPIITFLAGHGERTHNNEEDESDYYKVFNNHSKDNSLVNQGFETRTVYIKDERIPDSTMILIIADPTESYGVDEMAKIQSYINEGGNLVITGSLLNRNTILPVMEQLGITASIADSSYKYGSIDPAAVIHDGNAKGFLRNETMWTSSADITILDKEGNGAKLSMPNSFSMKQLPGQSGFSVRPVVLSDADTLIYALTRNVSGKQQRILICGSADFLSNGAEGIGFKSGFDTKAQNQRVAVAFFKWLSNDKYPSDAHKQRRKENIIIKSSGMLKLFLVGLFPLPFFIIGLLVLKNRRNH